MEAAIRQSDVIEAHDSCPTSGNPTSDTSSKKDWVHRYAERIYTLWLRRQTCLGVTPNYVDQLRRDLAQWYDEPLRKMFIEASY